MNPTVFTPGVLGLTAEAQAKGTLTLGSGVETMTTGGFEAGVVVTLGTGAEGVSEAEAEAEAVLLPGFEREAMLTKLSKAM